MDCYCINEDEKFNRSSIRNLTAVDLTTVEFMAWTNNHILQKNYGRNFLSMS